MAGLSEYFRELRRRNVFRVGTAYAIVAWLIVQIASIALPTYGAPEWVMQVLLILVVLGFPLALVFAWAFELTPEGLKREREVVRAESVAAQTGRKLDYFIIAVLSAAVMLLVLDKIVWKPEPADEVAARSAEVERSIAVLPFENFSGDLANDPFTVGVHDDLLTQLSKISSFKTISRTSVQQYRNTNKTISEIADELGVATVLEGGVQRSGDRIRFNVQLIDAETDAHLWAETYDRRLTVADIFAIQTEIATSVCDALQATLSPDEEHYLAKVPTESLEAYEAYQLGRQAMQGRVTTSIAEAVDYFSEATTIDPKFGLAWAGLSDAYQYLAYYSGRNVDELLRQAREAIDRALQLDDQISEAQSALATLLESEGDKSGAMMAFERSLKLDPNNANARFQYATVLYESGNLDRALEEFERAARLDPLSPVINDSYAFTLAAVGRFDEALSRYRIVHKIDADFPMAAVSIGTIYGLAYGQLDQAYAWYRKALAADPDVPFYASVLGLVALQMDDYDAAENWIERALQKGPRHAWANGAMVMLQSYRGNMPEMQRHAKAVFESEPRWRFGTALSHARVPDLRSGNYESVLKRYEASYPELFANPPGVNAGNYRSAIDLAGVYLEEGDRQRAAYLLAQSQEQMSRKIRLGFDGYGVSDVQVFALLGRSDDALAALHRAIGEGWRVDWQYFFDIDPNLDSIRDHPTFLQLRSEVEQDVAEQLERSREMDASGELAPVPEEGA
ncbi:MAG: tetratricopeptide repeat protein [Gammaproteobacteria bacterium]|nr:tetratricopeptide repeat protein [Gammaproteobacteria bacterium]